MRVEHLQPPRAGHSVRREPDWAEEQLARSIIPASAAGREILESQFALCALGNRPAFFQLGCGQKKVGTLYKVESKKRVEPSRAAGHNHR